MRVQEKCRLAAPENDYIKESCQKAVDFFNNQIDELNDSIQKIIDGNPELQKRQKIIRTVPGRAIIHFCSTFFIAQYTCLYKAFVLVNEPLEHVFKLSRKELRSVL